MSEVKVYNPGDTPVLITGPHTSVGGHEWATVRHTKEVQGMIEDDRLVQIGELIGDELEESEGEFPADEEQKDSTSGDNAPATTKVTGKSTSRSNKEG